MRKILAVAGTVAAFGMAGVALAQTTLPEGVTETQMGAALEDLSAVYGTPVVRLDQAKAICNEEQYIVECAEIGKKHDLFPDERTKQVDTLLTELKGEAVEKLKRCGDVTCLVDVATSIASRLNSGNPAVARAVELTPQKVREKRGIVEAAKSLGVDIEACWTMDPDTATVELLRSCARLAKHENVQKYIPQETKDRAEEADAAIALKESLASGNVACGDNTLEGCGSFCLTPSAETRAQGVAAIPPVCRQIATQFFGDKGIQELERAYTTVQKTFDTLSNRAQNAVFRTADGRTFVDPAFIGKYMEEVGSRGDVDAVSDGMDFLIAKGLVTEKERDFALGMVQKIKERGPVDGPVNFDECRADPSRCADLISEEERGQFSVMGEIDTIMRGEMAKRGITDPSNCSSDQTKGASCLEAARAALPQIELLAGTSPQARPIISDIRQKIRFGEAGLDARSRVEERFKTTGDFSIGERRFGSFNEIEGFCQTNPQQCLTETTREGIFSKDIAAEKYEHAIDVSYRAIPPENVQGAQPVPGAFNKEEALQQFKQWLDNPRGAPPMPPGMDARPYPQYPPYPPSNPYSPYPRPFIEQRSNCHQDTTAMPPPCRAGEYRQESTNEFGCSVFGSCIPLTTRTEPPRPDGMKICPALPTVVSCPTGAEKVISYSSPECGTYYTCRPVDKVDAGVVFPYTFTDGKRMSSLEEARAYCLASGVGSGIANECTEKFGVVYANQPIERNCASKYGEGWRTMDSSGNCFNPSMTEYRTAGGTLNSCATAPVYGCSSSDVPPSPPPSTGQREQVWNAAGLRSWVRTDADAARIESLEQACASVSSQANVWLPAAGTQSSTDFGMPDPEKCAKAAACSSTQRFDGTACVTSTSSQSCGYNEYWNGSACVTSTTQNNTVSGDMKRCFYPNASKDGKYVGYTVWCESDYYNCHEGEPSGASVGLSGLQLGAPSSCESGWGQTQTSCSSGQYWNGSACVTSTTQTNTTTGSCSSELIGLLGSGCHSMGSGWFNSEMTKYVLPGSQTVRSCTTEYLSGCTGGTNTQTQTSCSSGQYWNGSACVTSTIQTYCPSGQYVNGACAYSATACPSGQYWNGSSCVPTSPTDCPSGQYWNGSSCVSSTQTQTTGTYDTTSAQQGCQSAGGTWDSAANYCRMPSSSNTYTVPPTGSYTPPPTESYTPPPTTSSTPPPTESYTPPPTTATEPVSISYLFCPSGHDWNGAYCVLSPPSPFERYTASVWSATRSLLGI